MWKRLAAVWIVVKSDLKLLWFALKHPQAPGWLKLGVVGLALYFLLPIDLIPDFIPGLGVVDDLVLIPLALGWLLRKLPEAVRRDAEREARGGSAAEDIIEEVR